jgi:hypothetical protein
MAIATYILIYNAYGKGVEQFDLDAETFDVELTLVQAISSIGQCIYGVTL